MARIGEITSGLRILFLILFGSFSIGLSESVVEPAVSWRGADGEPLPFSSYEGIEDFLLTAKVVDEEVIPIGTTKPKKVLLEEPGTPGGADLVFITNLHGDGGSKLERFEAT